MLVAAACKQTAFQAVQHCHMVVPHNGKEALCLRLRCSACPLAEVQAHNVSEACGGAGGTKQACSLLQLLQAIISSQPIKEYGHSSEDLHCQSIYTQSSATFSKHCGCTERRWYRSATLDQSMEAHVICFQTHCWVHESALSTVRASMPNLQDSNV